MKSEKQQQRRREIEAAAYQVLAEKGYKGTSMLLIAKRASASNETLYKWYGTKQALFQAMIEKNITSALSLFESFDAEKTDPLDTIRQLGPILLKITTGEKAVTLNRAAVGDVHDTGKLGAVIATGGKQTIVPRLRKVFKKAAAAGLLQIDGGEDAAEIYISLLIGDLQIQRVIGVRPALKDKEIADRAERAFRLTTKLFAVKP